MDPSSSLLSSSSSPSLLSPPPLGLSTPGSATAAVVSGVDPRTRFSQLHQQGGQNGVRNGKISNDGAARAGRIPGVGAGAGTGDALPAREENGGGGGPRVRDEDDESTASPSGLAAIPAGLGYNHGHPFSGVVGHGQPTMLSPAGGGGDDGGAGQVGGPELNRTAHTRRSLSEPDVDTEGVGSGEGRTGGGSASKKRKTAPGSRGVANLTPEQLAKKRANDREAQRAIRERQRLRTEHLEQEIRELKSQRPYQELQTALQQTAAVQAEVDGLKQVLTSIVAMIEPLINRPPTSVLYGSTPTATPTTCTPTATAPSVTSPTSIIETDHHHQQHTSLQSLDLGPERLGLGFVLGPHHRIAQVPSGIHGAQDSPRYRHVPMKHDWTATAAGSVTSSSSSSSMTAPSSGLSSGPAAPPPPQPPPSLPLPRPFTDHNHNHNHRPIKNCPPTCPLDSLLLDFLSERRQRAADGLPRHEIIGPRYPSVSSLLNPSISRYAHPLSKVFTDILACFPDLSTLPERVAVLHVMFLLTRWQVSLSTTSGEEDDDHDEKGGGGGRGGGGGSSGTYERLPEWMRPVEVQLMSEHPAWVDHVPFPRMREKVVRLGCDEVPFENFFIPFTSTLGVGWPYEEGDVLLRWGGRGGGGGGGAGDEGGEGGEEGGGYGGGEEGEISINPVFERHLRRIENWTLGEAFRDAFPGLDGTYNIRMGDGRVKLVGEW
ncbi:BZIP transcription factor [Echria macrotheca]|uniref:BZIP transcription factor n=1 Tax=Echria macrotheca TaxID=438768 RepID=A0AAJ0FAW6_9PEZI|nr:BZIP transcription factor [Echria macrotheca]